MPHLVVPASTGLTITNPLVLYRALLATRQIDPVPAQHRLALHLQKLYFRLKDYSPEIEYGARLKAATQAVEEPLANEEERTVAVAGHPLRRNPLFSHLFTQKEKRTTLALTRVLTDHESAMKLESPRGLLLYGEVGTGKSMLLDLLADSLPNKKKVRWHFNTFMLETLSRLESLRQSRLASPGMQTEYSLIWLAKDMIEKSPILFLDEFQLPDRAASKILSNLLTTFFQLGGVLIASSNRMPEELAKASGVEFAPPPREGLVRNLLGMGPIIRGRGVTFAGNSEYSGFLDVLKARCEVWDMGGERDWRRREIEELDSDSDVETLREEMVDGFSGLEGLNNGNLSLGYEQNLHDQKSTDVKATEDNKPLSNAVAPKNYLLQSMDTESTWQEVVQSAVAKSHLTTGLTLPIPWSSTTLLIYGRRVPVPREHGGVALWAFSELCGGALGPADYITITSTFHTIILDEVPILTVLQKNEARRLITLLDALYEAKCKLVIRAQAGPDNLFFPEITRPASNRGIESSPSGKNENDGEDAVYPETLSEIYQDQTSPFRPNISAYANESKTGYDPDEDSEFGPSPGQGNEIGRQVDFGNTSSFTGEDERFAYKRARSRLWEMCGSRWHSRSEPGWWRPLPLEIRRWERSSSADPLPTPFGGILTESDVQIGPSFELDRPAGLQGKELDAREQGTIKDDTVNPWKQKDYPPPKIGWSHAWGMMTWGKRAGVWGQGTAGLDQRNRDKRSGNEKEKDETK